MHARVVTASSQLLQLLRTPFLGPSNIRTCLSYFLLVIFATLSGNMNLGLGFGLVLEFYMILHADTNRKNRLLIRRAVRIATVLMFWYDQKNTVVRILSINIRTELRRLVSGSECRNSKRGLLRNSMQSTGSAKTIVHVWAFIVKTRFYWTHFLGKYMKLICYTLQEEYTASFSNFLLSGKLRTCCFLCAILCRLFKRPDSVGCCDPWPFLVGLSLAIVYKIN